MGGAKIDALIEVLGRRADLDQPIRQRAQEVKELWQAQF